MFSLKRLLFIGFHLMSSCMLYGQVLMPGDFAFIAYNVDGDDDFAIVLLKDVTNRTVYFTDHEVDGMNPLDKSSSEGTLTWQTGLATIPAGTVVIFTDASVAGGVSHGTVSEDDAGFNLAGGGDALLAFEGSDNCNPISYIAGLQNARDANSFGNLTGTGLNNCTAITISNTVTDEGAKYTGVRNTASTFGAYLDSIKNIDNWTTSTSDGESLLPFDNTAFSVTGSCSEPYITGRDTTICMGGSLDLKLLLSGTFEGGLRYGNAFGNYPDTITFRAIPAITTTYFIQDSVAGTTCVDTAQVTVTLMDCSIPCDIDISFADTVCNADGTYDLKIAVDSTMALSDRLVVIIDGKEVDTLPYPSADGLQICIETELTGDGDNGLQLIVADTMKGESMLFVEDFETDGNGSRYITSIPEFKEADSDFFGRTDGSDIGTYTVSGQSGSFFFGIEDVNANGASDVDTLKIEGIDISLAKDLMFKGLFAEEDASDTNEDWDTNTTLKVQSQIDGGGYRTILQFSDAGGSNTEPLQDIDFDGVGEGMALSPVFTEFAASISGEGTTLDILIIIEKFNDGDEDISFDNLMVKGNTYICSDTLIFNEPMCQVATIATIADPCDCCNPDNLDITGDGLADIFKETVVITSNPGEVWMVTSSSGLLDVNGNSIASLTFSESPLGTYLAEFHHAGETGYTASFSNGMTTLSASNSCTACTSIPPIPDAIVQDIALCYDGQSSTRITPYHVDSIVLGEDFESDGFGSRYFLDRETFTTLADTSVSASSQGKHFLIRTDGSNIRSTTFMFEEVQGSYWFGASDLNIGSMVLPAAATMTFATNGIEGLCDLSFSVFIAEDDVGDGSTSHWNNEDYVHFDYSIDGGAYQDLLHLESDGGAGGSPPFVDTDFDGIGDGTEVTDTFKKFTAPIVATGDSITLRISMYLDASEEDIAFDSIRISGIPATYNFYDGDPRSGGTLLARGVVSYDPMVTRANSPQTIWVEPLCGSACSGTAVPVIVGVHPESDSSIICFDEVNVSEGDECDLRDADIRSFYAGPLEPIYFDLLIKTKDHQVIHQDSLYKYVNERLLFEVVDTCTENRCWGYVNIEDKLPPKAKDCPCDASDMSNLSASTAADSCIFFCLDSMYFYEPLFSANCLTGMTADALGIYLKTDSLEVGCDTFQIIRRWMYDQTIHGKVKTYEVCKQLYYKVPLPSDSIMWPPPKLRLACDSIDLHASIHQIVESYGKHFAGPYFINNVNDTILLTDDSLECHLPITYEDQFIQTCVNESRLSRTWRVLDWCTQTYFDSTILIDVKDKRPPDFGVVSVNAEPINEDEIVIDGDTFAVENIQVEIDLDKIFRLLEIKTSFDCSVDFEIPEFENLSDNCTSFENVKLEYAIDSEVAYFDSDIPRLVRNVPLGGSRISITAYDECGNSKEHSLFLTVLDKAEPIALCNDTIRTTIVDADLLLDGGVSQIPVSAFDRQTYDNCGEIILTLARRQDGKFTCGGQSLKFIGTDYLEFCCEDIGNYIPVELTFFDDGGNQEKCVSQIYIENKNSTLLECEDVVVSCTDPIHPDHLGYPKAYVTCADQNLSWKDSYHVDDLCFQGYIERVWYADSSGSNCTQIITISDNDSSSEQAEFNPESIHWPLHYTGESLEEINLSGDYILIEEKDEHGNCNEYSLAEYENLRKSIDPSFDIRKDFLQSTKMLPNSECLVTKYNEPHWTDPDCGLIGKTFEDQTFSQHSEVCNTILRKWIIIDWCTYDSKAGNGYEEKTIFVNDFCNGKSWFAPLLQNNEKDGYYTFLQEIRVVDITAPKLIADKEIEVEVGLGDKNDHSECEGTTEVTAYAEDSCNDFSSSHVKGLNWELKVVKIAQESGKEQVIINHLGEEWTSLSPKDDGSVSHVLNGLAGEIYHLKWRVWDGCNNRAESSTKVSFIDHKAPNLLCHSKISLNSPSADDKVIIWALDIAQAHDCSGQEIEVWFKSQNGNYISELTFVCSDILAFEDYKTTVQVYAIDEEMNESFCSVDLDFSSVEIKCSEQINDSMQISGAVSTVEGNEIENVQVFLSDRYMETKVDGRYAFGNIYPYKNYSLSAFKNDDVLNGVSALDLLLIQKHILGLSPFDSPFKRVAADVNNDGRISSLDLVALRKVILGLEKEFENNTSWRFTEWNNSSTPSNDSDLKWDQSIALENVSSSFIQDFKGIKIGDVSGDVISNSTMAEPRNKNVITLNIEDKNIAKGQLIELPVTMNSDIVIDAFQFTLDIVDLEFIEIKGNDISISDGGVGYHKGKYSVVWYDIMEKWNESESFILKLKANRELKLSEAIQITSEITRASAYSSSGEDFGIELEYVRPLSGLTVHHVRPNPFRSRATIDFEIALPSEVKMMVFDIGGRILNSHTEFLKSGLHSWIIDETDLIQSGVYYVQIESENELFNGKLIKID